mmetsp:Transcript_21208/g.68693  ORF Transcript_21208/g.68693 Transcript_21208/m.68693 type:complete len:189 (-) Transcript_21208:1145-1711(-)
MEVTTSAGSVDVRGGGDEVTGTFSGRLLHKRAVSKRLLFFDLEDVSKGELACELALKTQALGGGLSEASFDELKRTLRVGDVVRAEGRIQENRKGTEPILLVTTVAVLEKGPKVGPGLGAAPAPPAAASQRPGVLAAQAAAAAAAAAAANAAAQPPPARARASKWDAGVASDPAAAARAAALAKTFAK